MPLDVGDRLGHYDVKALIGEGGMGQVYRASDTQLGRDVALKILPDAFASDPDRLARFQREAQVLASLNHPNIAQIHGIEEAEGTRALVLELVEGPTLADRIAGGPIPIDEALPIAKQIAEALEAAHEAGVIHRDLKPANIKVREDGTVKVLDFGLAKALEGDAGSDPSESPTMTAAATRAGVIMGTAADMSPEQASGATVDRRADIWSFGVVLFEMLTGRRLFTGATVSHVVASVLKTEPDWAALPPDTPTGLRRVLRRCLAKDRKERLHDIADARLEIAETLGTPDTETTNAVAVPRLRVWQRPVPAMIAALALIAIGSLAAWTLTRPEPTPAPSVVRFTIVPSDNAQVTLRGGSQNLAISPDGTQVIYQVGTGQSGTGRLNVRRFDQPVDAPLRGGDVPASPFFSHDGAWVGFGRWKVSLVGGPRLALPRPGSSLGRSWGADDRIIYGGSDRGLLRVSADGGEPETLTILDTEQGETSHSWPFIVPGRDAVLFVISTGPARTTGQLAVLDLNTRDVTRLGLAGVSPRYVSTGHLVYAAEDASVRAVAFDSATLTVTGTPVPLVEGIVVKTNGSANFSISDDGRLVYVLGESLGTRRSVVQVDRQGREEPLMGLEPGAYGSLRLSPDGRQLALEIRVRVSGGDAHLWIHDVARGVTSPLTTESGVTDTNPVWTPDGAAIVFCRNNDLFWTPADGRGVSEELLTRQDRNLFPENWTPDGRLLFTSFHSQLADIEVLSMEGDRTPEGLLQTDAPAGGAVVSLDGQWIAYHAVVLGRGEVYVARFPLLGDPQQVSPDGGRAPLWSPDGSELFYLSPDGRQVMKVAVSTEPTLTVGTPQMLFDGDYLAPDGLTRPWSLTPDGQRFVMIKNDPDEAATLRTIHVVLNWHQELIERVPVP